jgi:hypothetical protein
MPIDGPDGYGALSVFEKGSPVAYTYDDLILMPGFINVSGSARARRSEVSCVASTKATIVAPPPLPLRPLASFSFL